MKVNAFILNSDFDGQKEYADITLSLDIAAHKTPGGDIDDKYTATALAPSGEFFVNATTECNLIPGQPAPGEFFDIDGGSAELGTTYRLIVYIRRKDNTHYALTAQFLTGGEKTNVPRVVLKSRVRLYVASKSE